MAVSRGTVGVSVRWSSLKNALHSALMLARQIKDFRPALRESERTELQKLHEELGQMIAFSHWLLQHCKQEMADLLDSGFSKPPVPKNRTRSLSFPSKYREKPVERVRPKCSPRRIIHQPR